MAKSKKESNTLYIKNMVCRRCLNTVRKIFVQAGVDIQNVQLGEVVVKFPPNDMICTQKDLNYLMIKQAV